MKRSGLLVLVTLALTACGASPDAADSNNYDAVDGSWSLTTRLSPQSLTPDGENTLYYEQALTATSAWGPIEVDRSNGERGIGDGKPLTLNGVKHAKGYGVHAPSELKYSLAGTNNAVCVRFKAQIGLDDEVGRKGSAVFQIWGDTGKLFDSGVMTGDSPTQSVDVDLRGQSTFRMVVTDAGDGKSFDHADWIHPTITCQASAPSLTLDPPALSVYHLHTGTLKATFTGYERGAVNVELDPPESRSVPGENDIYPYPLVLQTTTVTLKGAAPETHDLVIAAPEKFGFADFSSDFHLLIKRNGQLLNRVPVQLTELPIKFTAVLEPAVISGRAGEVKNLLLTVTADPPLERAYPVGIGFQDFPGSNILPAGPVTGNGARMQVPLSFQIVNYGPDATHQVRAGIAVGDSATGYITTGYRDILYGSLPQVTLDFTVVP